MNTYYIGLADHDHYIYDYQDPENFSHTNSYYASLIWVYMIFPFIGALFGMLFFKSLIQKKGV